MKRFIAASLLLVAALLSSAFTPAYQQLLNGGCWQGAAVDLNFAGNQYCGQSNLTVTRASVGYIDDLSGNWVAVPAGTLRVSNNGALIEEARTNSLRNNSMTGAVAGSPGTAPTNTGGLGGSVDGLTQTINLVGTENGIDILEVRWTGTTNAARTNRGFYVDEASTQIVAAATETWTNSRFLSLVGGSLSNLTITHGPIESTSGGVFVSGAFTPVVPTATLTRYSSTRTLSGGTTARVNGGVFFSYGNGVAIDITLRIGWPQLELGAFATSPIRTTSAAATRAADVVSIAGIPASSAATLYLKGKPNSPVTNASNQLGLQFDDGTTTNRLSIYRASTSGVATPLNTVASGSPSNVGAWAQDTSARVAFAADASSAAASKDGGAVNTASPASFPPGLTRLQIGQRTSDFFFNGYIERVAFWPNTRLSNAQLQALTR